jgi:hypothetical protein
MKKLKDLTGEQLKVVYHKNDILKQMAENEYKEGGFDFIREKILKLKKGFLDYNFGLYEYNNFFKINKNVDLIEIIENYIDDFSASVQIFKMMENKENEIEIFSLLVKEEIIEDIKYLEDVSDGELYDYFMENIVDYLDNFYINEKGILIEIKEYN